MVRGDHELAVRIAAAASQNAAWTCVNLRELAWTCAGSLDMLCSDGEALNKQLREQL